MAEGHTLSTGADSKVLHSLGFQFPSHRNHAVAVGIGLDHRHHGHPLPHVTDAEAEEEAAQLPLTAPLELLQEVAGRLVAQAFERGKRDADPGEVADADHRLQELLDKVRAEHATRYLQNTRLPLSTIAYMVGFNDASNFRRAYLKWTGRSPRDVRSGS